MTTSRIPRQPYKIYTMAAGQLYHITFKLASLIHQVLHQRCPVYLTDLVEFNSEGTQRRLRSTTTRAAVVRPDSTSSDGGPSLFVVQKFGILFPCYS